MKTRVALALIAAALVCSSGCAAVKTLLPTLAEYGIAKAEELAAGGKAAIAEARARALEIPDQLEQMAALLEVVRAEQIYQTTMIEALVADAYGDEQEVGDPTPEE